MFCYCFTWYCEILEKNKKMNAMKIGFIGGGKMAQAMAKGFLEAGNGI